MPQLKIFLEPILIVERKITITSTFTIGISIGTSITISITIAITIPAF